MITFANRETAKIKVGDIMRQADEHKNHTDFYHYRATRVFIGDLAVPIHDLDGKYIGDRIEKNVVIIDWTPIEKGKPFSMKYHPLSVVEIANEPVNDPSNLLATEYHAAE